MTKTRRADILPIPTSAEISSRANELRAVLSLDDSADEREIRSELKSLRAEALENFEVDYLVGCGSMVHYMLEMI